MKKLDMFQTARLFHLDFGTTSLSKMLVREKGIFTKSFILKAIISLFPSGHVRIFYGPPPTLYADGLSDLCRTCIGGESEVVRSQVMFVAVMS